jgi:hypothetical protein
MSNCFLNLSDEQPSWFRYSEKTSSTSKDFRSKVTFKAINTPDDYGRIDTKGSCCFVEASRLSRENDELLSPKGDIYLLACSHDFTCGWG